MPMSKEVLVGPVLRGALAANTKYERRSAGSWLTNSGVEGFMVGQLAERLKNEQDGEETILLEAPFELIRYWWGAARRRGRPREVLRGSRRMDIALFDACGRTASVIGVKRSWERAGFFLDIDRLLALLNACNPEMGGSSRRDILALLIVEWAMPWAEARAKVQNGAERIKKKR